MLELTKSKVSRYLNFGITMREVRALVKNSDVLDSIETTLDHETEALTNDPLDSGGLTKWGVTENTARGLGFVGDMNDITKQKAILIAAYKYYFKSNVYKFNTIVGERFTSELFDASYLLGEVGAMKIVQRFLNAMNRNEQDWPDLENLDGLYGPKTEHAIKCAFNIRGEDLLLKHLRGSLYVHFLLLVEKREKDERFFNGWVANRIGV